MNGCLRKFLNGVGRGLRKNQVDFGGDPRYFVDLRSFSSIGVVLSQLWGGEQDIFARNLSMKNYQNA